jgi:hypothetical protein
MYEPGGSPAPVDRRAASQTLHLDAAAVAGVQHKSLETIEKEIAQTIADAPPLAYWIGCRGRSATLARW